MYSSTDLYRHLSSVTRHLLSVVLNSQNTLHYSVVILFTLLYLTIITVTSHYCIVLYLYGMPSVCVGAGREDGVLKWGLLPYGANEPIETSLGNVQ